VITGVVPLLLVGLAGLPGLVGVVAAEVVAGVLLAAPRLPFFLGSLFLG